MQKLAKSIVFGLLLGQIQAQNMFAGSTGTTGPAATTTTFTTGGVTMTTPTTTGPVPMPPTGTTTGPVPMPPGADAMPAPRGDDRARRDDRRDGRGRDDRRGGRGRDDRRGRSSGGDLDTYLDGLRALIDREVERRVGEALAAQK